MKTRDQYMNKECTHQDYYLQFATPALRSTVIDRIGLQRIVESTDPHFNDIPWRQWYNLLPFVKSMAKSLKPAGDYLTLAGAVCICKAIAEDVRNTAKLSKQD